MTLNAVIALFFHGIRQIFRPIISVVEDLTYNVRKILSPSSSLLLAKTITHGCSAVSLR